jgi:hypothetical protein
MTVRVLLDSWTHSAVHEWPYRWLSTEDGQLLAPENAVQLACGFPDAAFTRYDESARRGRKSYRNFSRELVAPDGSADDHLPPLWRDLLADLLDPAYRRAVAELLAQPPARRLEVRLVRHTAGDWLSPHTDRADKRFSHILYFNPGWQADWGGCLEILESHDANTVVARVVPRLGTSALLVRAVNSWHQVTAVAPGAAVSSDRMSLLVHGLQ